MNILNKLFFPSVIIALFVFSSCESVNKTQFQDAFHNAVANTPPDAKNAMNGLTGNGTRFPSGREFVEVVSNPGDISSCNAHVNHSQSRVNDMQGVIDALREIQKRRCRSGNTSIAQCEVRSSGDHSSGRCWQAVKIALKEAGVVDHYLSSASAIDAHRRGILKNAGFCQLQVNSSREAPVGAILVYRWNQNRVNAWNRRCHSSSCRVNAPKYGHIEVKAGAGEYLSDIKLTTPMDETAFNQSPSGPKRSLEAVYVKGPCHEN